jgi:CRP/FNR family transcriptional regulator, cyclic AMP receptor protein
MVSSEILRRYPFFAGLANEQLSSLARLTEEVTVTTGDYLFYEGVNLAYIYLVAEGSIAITLSQPEVVSRVIIPPPGARTREVAVSAVGPGDLVGWSALVPPFKATSSARTATRSRCYAINAAELRQLFEIEPRFGYQIMQRVAQVARDRIHDLHYESLAKTVGE